jgi:small-conductance mechanosensitive channel
MDRTEYRVKNGREHEGKGPGEIFSYTEEEARPFLDKLEPVGATPQVVQDKQSEIDQLKLRLKEVETELNALKADQAKEEESEMSKKEYDGVQAPGGGFEPYNATVDQVKTWLEEKQPSKNQAAVVLQSEKDGKNRKSVVEALEAYIAEKAG